MRWKFSRAAIAVARARFAIGVAALAAAGLVSCSENAKVPQGYPCPAIEALGPFLLYPVPGATNVPKTSGVLVLAYVPTAGSGLATRPITTELLDSGGTAIVFTDTYGAAPSPLPSPYATAPANFSTGVGPAVSVPYPMLRPSATYRVTYNDGSTGRCPTLYGSQAFTTGP